MRSIRVMRITKGNKKEGNCLRVAKRVVVDVYEKAENFTSPEQVCIITLSDYMPDYLLRQKSDKAGGMYGNRAGLGNHRQAAEGSQWFAGAGNC